MTESFGIAPELPTTGVPGRRGAGSNAAWLTLEKIVHLGVAFVVTIVVARELGAEDFGRIALGLALIALVWPVSSVVAQCLVRDEVAEPDAANALYSAALVVAGLVCSLVVLVIGAVTAVSVGVGSDTGIVILVMVGSTLIRPLMVVDAWFIVRMVSKRAVIVRVSALLLTGAVRVALPLLGFGVVAVAWTYLAEAVLSAIGMWVVYRRQEKSYRWEFDRAKVRSLLKEMAPLLITTSSVLIFTRIDQIMLAPLSGLAEAGVFAVAASLALTPRFPLVALLVSSAPRMLRLKHTDIERYHVALVDLSRTMTLLGYGLTLVLIAVVAPLAPLLLGPDYQSVSLVIVILALSTPIACVGNILVGVTNWEKLYREAVTRNVVATVLSIALNFVLLPRYGAVGAAVTTLIATAWVYLIGPALAPRTRPVLRELLPSLEPISSTRVLLRHRREKRRVAADQRA
ncbi:flippase [soil metagenome]